MNRVAILGSTGSIGVNALKVISGLPGKFRVCGLSTNSNIGKLKAQIKKFRPGFVCVKQALAAKRLRNALPPRVKLFVGDAGLETMIKESRPQKLLVAISGSAALSPILKAIENRQEVILANKEALVMAGPIIMQEARKKRVRIIPVDSEQSAIWQCLEGKSLREVKKIYLTASGGPFLHTKSSKLKDVSVDEVLKHPRWKMGKKISVDSANLMNKGLELLEAIVLFGVGSDKIKILIHPQAIVHSMVEFLDGSILAQMSATDMRIPIQYALSFPHRFSTPLPSVDFCHLRHLDFQEPDFKKFPCLGLAYRAAEQSGSMPAVLNAANEVCVEGFLQKKIKFLSIPGIIERVMDGHYIINRPALADIREADTWARERAASVISGLSSN